MDMPVVKTDIVLQFPESVLIINPFKKTEFIFKMIVECLAVQPALSCKILDGNLAEAFMSAAFLQGFAEIVFRGLCHILISLMFLLQLTGIHRSCQ